VWLAKVAERQMLRPSFVPPAQIRLLRDLTRYRADLVDTRTAEKNRVEKLLEDAQIKLSVVASDIFGVSGREMMAALLAGEHNPKALAQLARTRMRAKIGLLEEAFVGRFTNHHAFLLRTMLARIDEASADIAAVETQIEELITPFAHAVERLDEITGVGITAAHVMVAEIGIDMSRFPTAAHLCSWARFAPGVKESAGKKKGQAPPGTVTPTWPGSWERPRYRQARPTPSSGIAIGASPAVAARRRPSSLSAAQSWSSSRCAARSVRCRPPTRQDRGRPRSTRAPECGACR
jgi:transposase